jgi:hypothetical protein
MSWSKIKEYINRFKGITDKGQIESLKNDMSFDWSEDQSDIKNIKKPKQKEDIDV